MFDPNVSDPLVIEHGPEAYGVIAPMEFVVNAAIYTDIAHMRVGHVEGTSGEKAEIYYPKGEQQQDQNDSLMVKDETFPELGELVVYLKDYIAVLLQLLIRKNQLQEMMLNPYALVQRGRATLSRRRSNGT